MRAAELRERRILDRESRLARLASTRESSLASSVPPGTPGSTADDAGGIARRSARKRKAAEQEEERWYFDCGCGVHGDNLDDGTPIIACGRCNIWQHILCLAAQDPTHDDSDEINIARWESTDFVCSRCLQKENRGDEPTPDPPMRTKFRISFKAGGPDGAGGHVSVRVEGEPESDEGAVQGSEEPPSVAGDEGEGASYSVNGSAVHAQIGAALATPPFHHTDPLPPAPPPPAHHPTPPQPISHSPSSLPPAPVHPPLPANGY
ncbi:hypothetical protein BDK51DRAFT_40072 [Blyttiomyces helicus]|uniref:Zinc finger PHD-type domain-containing protein n=1 Tax=Blyttiomyces helicus TaxID=388810 RepID=A0A4P9WBT0_9FUNG|nr:hypothetical protein BDK51DRAFT_40072 [Blyttiomyces helicus]|eukprot:RKO89023.1 hypothetical protein BDK51DRAFT_40072 [Blyttiomyces helicus]